MHERWTLPAPGDIVWCHFPEGPARAVASAPGPKPRPALVIARTSRDDGVSVQVVYGTSRRVDRLKAGEFAIIESRHPEAFALAGLAYDAKFDFGAMLELPWNAAVFKVPPRAPHGQTPKLGTLHPSLMRAAAAAHAAVAGG